MKKYLILLLITLLITTLITGCKDEAGIYYEDNNQCEVYTYWEGGENCFVYMNGRNDDDFTLTFEKGEVITVEAKDSNEWKFDHWYGDISGTKNPRQVVVDQDMTISAKFVEKDPFDDGDGDGGNNDNSNDYVVDNVFSVSTGNWSESTSNNYNVTFSHSSDSVVSINILWWQPTQDYFQSAEDYYEEVKSNCTEIISEDIIYLDGNYYTGNKAYKIVDGNGSGEKNYIDIVTEDQDYIFHIQDLAQSYYNDYLTDFQDFIDSFKFE